MFSTTKKSAPRPVQYYSTTRSTTKKPNKPKQSSNSAWNTARPEFNPFQLDPSLLHNGYLFDKRQMQNEMQAQKKAIRPLVTTARPIFRYEIKNLDRIYLI